MKLTAIFVGLVAISQVTAQSASKHRICSERVNQSDCGRLTLNGSKECCRNTNSCLPGYEQSKCTTNFCCSSTTFNPEPPRPPTVPIPATPPSLPVPPPSRPPSGDNHETKFIDPSRIPQSEYPDVNLGRFPKYNPFSVPRGAVYVDSLNDIRGEVTRYTIVRDGNYRNANIVVNGGVLRAENLHRAVFTGDIKIEVRNGGVVDGLFFNGAAPKETGLITMGRGRLTNCYFRNIRNPRGYREGSNSRHRCVNQVSAFSLVDHNTFENICTASLTINMSARAGSSITYRNRFVTQCQKYTAEVWRAGGSPEASIFAKAFVDENYFTDQNGEHELMSLKSGGIYVRGNTITNSRGAITCRHGSNNVITNNWYGCVRKSSGAIRIFGDNHLVRGNYAENCGSDTYGVLTLGQGDNCSPDNGKCGYMRVRRAVVENNTCRNCGTNINFGGAGKASICPQVSVMSGNYNNRGPETSTDRLRNGNRQTCRAPGNRNPARSDQSSARKLRADETGPVAR